MKYLVLALYPIMGVILYDMRRKVNRRSLEQIVADSAQEHHAILNVFTTHPHGGTAQQYDDWLEEARTEKH